MSKSSETEPYIGKLDLGCKVTKIIHCCQNFKIQESHYFCSIWL